MEEEKPFLTVVWITSSNCRAQPFQLPLIPQLFNSGLIRTTLFCNNNFISA